MAYTKEQQKAYSREYYRTHRKQIREQQKQYYQEHREERCEHQKEYYRENKDRISAKKKVLFETFPHLKAKAKEYHREYYLKRKYEKTLKGGEQ